MRRGGRGAFGAVGKSDALTCGVSVAGAAAWDVWSAVAGLLSAAGLVASAGLPSVMSGKIRNSLSGGAAELDGDCVFTWAACAGRAHASIPAPVRTATINRTNVFFTAYPLHQRTKNRRSDTSCSVLP